MPTVQTLIERNTDFAANRFEVLPPIPESRTLLITCADIRVDPAHILGLELGQAGVIRNVGGRITPATVQMLTMLAAVAATEDASGDWELIVLQHTDCGMGRLTGFPELLADYFGIQSEGLEGKCVPDPHNAVKADIAELAANPAFPSTLTVSGLVYDVRTGAVTTVVPPGPLRAK
jgi:carbonic anhydrase